MDLTPSWEPADDKQRQLLTGNPFALDGERQYKIREIVALERIAAAMEKIADRTDGMEEALQGLKQSVSKVIQRRVRAGVDASNPAAEYFVVVTESAKP